MVPVLFIALAVLAWLAYTGRLKAMTGGDWIALVIALFGTRFLVTGQLPAAGAMLVGALGWAAYRMAGKPGADQQEGLANAPPPTLAEARILLGIDDTASAADIKNAHRQMIAKAHPDAGGDSELAQRLNMARDILLKNIDAKPS